MASAVGAAPGQLHKTYLLKDPRVSAALITILQDGPSIARPYVNPHAISRASCCHRSHERYSAGDLEAVYLLMTARNLPLIRPHVAALVCADESAYRLQIRPPSLLFRKRL